MSVILNKKKMFSLFWHSDQHTLHPHTPTPHILGNIDRLRREVGVESIDMEVWGGDLCEDNTDTSDPNYVYLQKWVREYLYDCHERKRIVRIIAGTFSHDWEQPEMFELLKPKHSPYIKYINTLSIEYIEEFDIQVMYVPDNFGHKPKTDIYEDALKLLASHGLKQVDFIFLHGGFDYQLPPMANKNDSLYNSKAWSALASRIILSGHIHKPSNKYNIYCSGSIDRLRHGEMHPKGCYNILFNEKETIPKFIENKNAMIYDTINIVPETTSKELVKIMDKYLSKRIMNGASIRVSGGSAEIVRPILEEYKLTYPQYIFESDNAAIAGVVINETIYEPEKFKAVTINKNNLEDNLARYIGSDFPLDIDMDYVYELLREGMENVK